LIPGMPFIARVTVWRETPAAAATSRIVARLAGYPDGVWLMKCKSRGAAGEGSSEGPGEWEWVALGVHVPGVGVGCGG